MVIIQVPQAVPVDVDRIRICVPVNYDEDDMPNDFPFRKGNKWEVDIDIESGQIRNWPDGVKHDLDMKVTDGGNYSLIGGNLVMKRLEQEYVPNFFPGSHYGDYIIFRISEAGVITNWQKPRPNELLECFYPQG